jgi:hypothetical protein
VLKKILDDNKEDEQIVLNNLFQVFIMSYNHDIMLHNSLVYVEKAINVIICII